MNLEHYLSEVVNRANKKRMEKISVEGDHFGARNKAWYLLWLLKEEITEDLEAGRFHDNMDLKQGLSLVLGRRKHGSLS